MTNQELVKLSDALQKYTDFLAPDPSCLAPLGEKPLEKGVNEFFSPDFSTVLQRSASAYSGFPFVVEIVLDKCLMVRSKNPLQKELQRNAKV